MKAPVYPQNANGQGSQPVRLKKWFTHAEILVDGNPFENLELVADPETHFKVTMKDGKIYSHVKE